MKRAIRSLVLAWMGGALLASCGPEGAARPGPEGTPPAAQAAPGAVAQAQAAPQARGEGKSAAPVDISAQIVDRTASVHIVFRVAATDVAVRVWGTDGLEIQGDAARVASRAVEQGEQVDVGLTFAAPPGPSNLAVSVTGVFAGRRQSTVRSFAIGGGPPASGAGDLRTDPDGRPVRVMKPR